MPTQEELRDNLTKFARSSALDVRAVRELVNGNKLTLALLATQDKTNLVNAINELVLRQGDSVSLEIVNEVVNDYFVLHPQTFTYDQNEPAMTWLITHPLDHNPAVTITDSAGTVWHGQVSYPGFNQVRVEFNIALSGKAVLT